MPAHMIFHWQEFVVLLFTAAIIWLVLWVVFSFKKRFLSSEQKNQELQSSLNQLQERVQELESHK